MLEHLLLKRQKPSFPDLVTQKPVCESKEQSETSQSETDLKMRGDSDRSLMWDFMHDRFALAYTDRTREDLQECKAYLDEAAKIAFSVNLKDLFQLKYFAKPPQPVFKILCYFLKLLGYSQGTADWKGILQAIAHPAQFYGRIMLLKELTAD
jgi:hypothetical protein